MLMFSSNNKWAGKDKVPASQNAVDRLRMIKQTGESHRNRLMIRPPDPVHYLVLDLDIG